LGVRWLEEIRGQRDVNCIAPRVREHDPALRVFWNHRWRRYEVRDVSAAGWPVILTAPVLDQRVLAQLRRIDPRGRGFAGIDGGVLAEQQAEERAFQRGHRAEREYMVRDTFRWYDRMLVPGGIRG